MTEIDPIREAYASLEHRYQELLEEAKRVEAGMLALSNLIPGAAPPIHTYQPLPDEEVEAHISVKSLMLRLLRESDRDWSVNEILDEYKSRHVTMRAKDPSNALRAAIAEANKARMIFRTAPGRYKAAKWSTHPLEPEMADQMGGAENPTSSVGSPEGSRENRPNE